MRKSYPCDVNSALLVLHITVRSTRVRTFVTQLVHRTPTVRTILQTATGSVITRGFI